MAYRVGNVAALMEALDKQARREGNESEHALGVSLINLARERGFTEEQLYDALATQDGPVFYYP